MKNKNMETIKRTGKESAILVEKVVTHILSEKRKKRIEMTKASKGSKVKQPKIDKDWFNKLIRDTCLKNDISEGHIRAVGVWNINDEVDAKDPE